MVSAGTDAPRTDWESLTEAVLDSFAYVTGMKYDALNRVTEMQFPEDVEQERKILLPRYNRSGALEQVGLKNTEASEEQVYVERIAYNARGQRTLIAFGNGMMTRYAYDEDNFRLKRLRTERYEKNGLAYNYASGTVRQDNFYEYDLSGNITSIINRAPGSGVGGTDILEKDYTYDALYRLLSATGRETATTAAEPWDDTYRSHDPTLTRGYTQHYSYDKMGNIQGLQHIATGGNFTRSFTYTENKNILEDITIGQTAYGFIHDVNGNIIREGESRHFAWDYADRLKSFRIQAGEGEPSLNAFYLYDSGGNRIKKLVQKQDGSYKSTTYIDGIFEHTRESISAAAYAIPNLEIGQWTIGVYDQGTAIPDLEIGQWIIGQYGGSTTEQNTLHIMDDQSRIATIRLGDAMGDITPAIKYNLEDHLGSSSIQLDTNGTLVNREEYTPFGETSFGSYGKKRYRFCGKEKDEESGLYAMGARMYSAWTCRFTSVDKMTGKHPNKTPYHYASNNPINRIDPSGMEDEPSGGGSGNDNIAQGTYTHESGEEYTYTGEEGVPEKTLKEFGWSKKIDVSNVSDKYVAQADNTRVEKPQFNPKDIKPSNENKESPKLNSAEQALRDETVKAATEKGSQLLEKKAETIQKDLRKEGLVGSSNGKNYQTTLKKDGTPRELGNKHFRTTGHMPNTATTKTLKLVAKGLSEIGNIMELVNMAEVVLGKAEPYTLLPLSFVNDEIFTNIDQALLSAALSQGYEATLNYKNNNEKLMKDFSMLYMNEADFNSLMSGEITDLSQIKSLGDMSHGFAAFAHRGKSLSVLAGFKFK
ncbi:RHS repeat-associated core domain-containing protein [Cytophagaceae bacterium ABcell3]|nr:RHS repeat-associated core domain-containing protein [Cytophagaceae bacterium ABcell3]